MGNVTSDTPYILFSVGGIFIGFACPSSIQNDTIQAWRCTLKGQKQFQNDYFS